MKVDQFPREHRIISEEELRHENARRTVSCPKCKQRIRYFLEHRTTDKPNDRRYILCPGCGHERVLAIGGIKDEKETST